MLPGWTTATAVAAVLGFDHEHFTDQHQSLDQRLTSVEPAHIIKELLA